MYIEINNACKKIKKQIVLNNVSLAMDKGKKYGIVGQNGCGKTMLLRAICGFIRLDQGYVIIEGKKIGEDGCEFVQDAGVVIGEATFQNSLTGYENLKILAEIQKKIDNAEIEEILHKVGLYNDKDKKFAEYSMGMKQRLRIAQAIMEHPKLLVLDEPFNGLDRKGVEEIRELLLEYCKKDITLILTSHNETDIKIMCDSVIEMDNGEIVTCTE